MSSCALVAVLGAESTGKSTLCRELAALLPALWVPEALRDFCDRHRRTPRASEQAALMAEQLAREHDALAHQRSYRHTLLTGLEVPWQADGIQRDGPQARTDFHRRLVTVLARAQIAHCVLPGNHDERRAMVLRRLRAEASALH